MLDGFSLRGRDGGSNVEPFTGDAPALRSPDGGSSHVFVKAARAQTADDAESWVEGDVAPTLNSFDSGDVRSTALVVPDDVGAVTAGYAKSGGVPAGSHGGNPELIPADVGNHHQRDRVYADEAPALDAHAHTPTDAPLVWAESGEDDLLDLLPAGLDSNRYRCCGNGVVAPVAEWIGRRIAAALTAEGD